MKSIGLILLAFLLAAQTLRAQLSGDLPVSAIRNSTVSYAPLLLSINGGGVIFPFHDGEMLAVGGDYLMLAIPERGYVFAGWQPADVFIFNQSTTDGSGNPLPPTVSTVWSPVPDNHRSALLAFTFNPSETVLLDVPGVETITQSRGWVANFVPVKR